MRVFDLERALFRSRAPPEYLQDQAGAIEHLGVPRLLEIALLHRRNRAIHDHNAGLAALNKTGDFVDLALADVSRGTDLGERDDALLYDVEVDGARKTDGLFEPC